MKIIIDEDICRREGLSFAEVLMMTLIKTGVEIDDLIKTMIKKKMLVKDQSLSDVLYVEQHWNITCDKVLVESNVATTQETKIESLAKTLMTLFPAGKKQGTSQYWRGNLRDNTIRLSKFFKLYGNIYTDEQIIEATKRYISSFNGNYQHMRVLKYFIWKDIKKLNSNGEGFIDEVSDLATFLENAKDENKMREDWMSTMV